MRKINHAHEVGPILVAILKESSTAGEPWMYCKDLAKRAGVSPLAVSVTQEKFYRTIVKRQDRDLRTTGNRRDSAYCLAPDLLKHHMGFMP